MKNKMVEFFKKFKELYADRRYRAMMTLGMYVCFFIIVFAILMTGKSSYNLDDNKELTVLDKFKAMNNYEYHYNIEKAIGEDSIFYDVQGKRYLNKETFTIKDDVNGYYVENNVIYITRDNIQEKLLDGPLNVDLTRLKPYNIVSYVTMAQLESTTNNYNDNTIKNSYMLPVKDFIKLYFNKEVEDKDNSFISISTYEKDDNIIKIEMDLTNADKYKEYDIDFHKLEFNYDNINSVADFDADDSTSINTTE